MTLIVADDDERFLDAVKVGLGANYQIVTCTSIHEMKEAIGLNPCDLLICDYDFGHENLERFLHDRPSHIPILVITGNATRRDLVSLLNFGVSGLLEKPVALAELRDKVAKICATGMNSRKRVLEMVGFELNCNSRTVICDQNSETLTPIEYKILDFFLKNSEKEIVRKDLEKYLWPETSVSRNTLDTHVGNLKKKIPPLNGKLASIYGTGYVLKVSR